MPIFSKAIGLLLIMLFSSSSAFAEWSRPYEIDYIMGDGDSRSSARQAAIEQIKTRASAEAGTYIQTTTTLHENGDLTESIQTLGASMVKVDVMKERLGVNPSGQAVLSLMANVTLDDAELGRRVKLLQEDKKRAVLVDQLKNENFTLRQELDQIHSALANKTESGITEGLLARQSAAINRLAENNRAVARVFEPGTLLSMANRNTDLLELAKRDLDENFYAHLMHSNVTAKIESVEATGDGYVALVRVGWDIKFADYISVLSRYLKVTGPLVDESMSVDRFENSDGRALNSLSEQIFVYLASKEVDIQIGIAGKQVNLPVFFTDNPFIKMPCSHGSREPSTNARYLCLVAQDKDAHRTYGSLEYASNPIRIPLTRAEAERATSITEKVIFR